MNDIGKLADLVGYVEDLRTPSGSVGGDGGTSGSKSKPAVNLDAVESLQWLAKTLAPLLNSDAFIEIREREASSGRSQTPLSELLRVRASASAAGLAAYIHGDIIEDCASYIEAKYVTKKTTRSLRFDCPVCNKGRDGQGGWYLLLDTAGWSTECKNCGTVWEREGLVELAEEVGLMSTVKAKSWLSMFESEDTVTN